MANYYQALSKALTEYSPNLHGLVKELLLS